MITQLDRQIFQVMQRNWRAKGESGGKKLRIALVGNCQSFGYAFGVKLLTPEAEVDRFALLAQSKWVDLKRLVSVLKTYDVVFSQDFNGPLLRDGANFDALAAEMPGLHRLPFVNFAGFHPDIVYYLDPTRSHKFIYGPTGVYNSGLAMFAFMRGMSVDQAEALYCEEVFEQVGYFDLWEPAAQEFLGAAASVGLNLETQFARWMRSGNFMYTPNHPKNFVMVDVARAALRKAGVKFTDLDDRDYSVDDLVRGFVLPLYPALAERYGLVGSDLFKLEHYKLTKGPGEFIRLREHIARTFAIFGKLKKEQIVNARVDGWLGDDETVRALTILSAEAMKRRAMRR